MELSRLKTFLNTLPSEYKLLDKWTERYIYDIDTFSGYEDARKIAIERRRYVNLEDMTEYGYDIDLFEDSCIQNNQNRQDNTDQNKNGCSSCCDYDAEKDKCIYNAEKCVLFFVENVKNWSELCGYHILFLQGKVPGTIKHPGPWNKETQYIIQPLTRILNHNILTADSQPGLIVRDENDEEYLQKPYLAISGPAGRIHRILSKIFSSENQNVQIKLVPYDLKEVSLDGYENYDDNDTTDYVEVMLGIDDTNYLESKYVDYVLSNRFFDTIADVVATTP